MAWRKLPTTHALALWLLVSCSLIAGVSVVAYMLTLAKHGKAPIVYPPRTPAVLEQMPSLVATVTSVGGDGLIGIDSKQPFTEVSIDEATDLSSLGGRAFLLADLRVGAKITVTGKDGGKGRMLAHALVVLENGPRSEERRVGKECRL